MYTLHTPITLCVLLLLFLHRTSLTLVFTDNTIIEWKDFHLIIFLREGFKLFYHPTPNMFNQNHQIQFMYKNNLFKMTNKCILLYTDSKPFTLIDSHISIGKVIQLRPVLELPVDFRTSGFSSFLPLSVVSVTGQWHHTQLLPKSHQKVQVHETTVRSHSFCFNHLVTH